MEHKHKKGDLVRIVNSGGFKAQHVGDLAFIVRVDSYDPEDNLPYRIEHLVPRDPETPSEWASEDEIEAVGDGDGEI